MVLFIFSHQLWPYLWTELFPVQVYTVSCRGLTSVAAFLCPRILALHSGFSLDFESGLKIEIMLTPSTFSPGLFLNFVPSPQLLVLAWVNSSYWFVAAQLISTSQALKPSGRAWERAWSCVSWNTALSPLWYRQWRNEIDGEGTWLACTYKFSYLYFWLLSSNHTG